MENIGLGLVLMIVGMVTVFLILLIVIFGSTLMIRIVNRIAPAETAKPSAEQTAVAVLNSIYTENRAPSEFADREKAEALLKQRAELVRRIQDERKRILKEDPKAKELNEDIMRQLRQLASILETKKSMIELNFQLDELDDAISRLKPAPPPETGTEDAKKEDAGKADKAGKADQAKKE